MMVRSGWVTVFLVAWLMAGCVDKKSIPPKEGSRVRVGTGQSPPSPSTDSPPVDTLAALPPGGAMYMGGDLALFDVVMDALPAEFREEVALEAARRLRVAVGTGDQLLGSLGVDATRPIWLAVVAPPHAGVEKLVDEIRAAKDETGQALAMARLGSLDPPALAKLRIVVPIKAGDARLLDATKRAGRLTRHECPSDAECQFFKRQPSVLMVGGELALAAYTSKQTTTLDFIWGTQVGGAALEALAAFHDQVGGPRPGQCSDIASSKGTSFCFDHNKMADGGVAMGLIGMVTAVDSATITSGQRLAIINAARDEALQNRNLVSMTPTILSDGTFNVRQQGNKAHVAASWRVAARAADGLRSFQPKQCAESPAATVALLEKLQKAMGVENARDPKKQDQFQEAGLFAWGIVAGGAWPAYLPFFVDKVKGAPTVGSTCIRFENERLHVDSAFALGGWFED